MTARPRRTTTLVGPNRVVLGAATAGLVALASAGTALLVLTGTSSVAPVAAPAPPLPSSAPFASAPGVVVLPPSDAGRLLGAPHRTPRQVRPAFRAPAGEVAPAALAFTDVPPVVPPAVLPAVAPPVAAPPVTAPPVAAPPVVAPPAAPRPPALWRAPGGDDGAADGHGRHLGKGHVKRAGHVKDHANSHANDHAKNHGKHRAKHVKLHGKRAGCAHSVHRGDR